MLIELFDFLTKLLYESLPLALGASFLWGIISIILSPCHLASIPLIIAFINGQGKISTRRAAILSFVFSAGILITITLIGIVTGVMGRLLGDIGSTGNIAVALIIITFGLYLSGLIKLNFLENTITPKAEKKGLLSAFLVGLIFGIALGPCSFAYMAPLIGIAFSMSTETLLLPVLLLTSYAIGHCLVIVLAGTFTEMVQKILNWNEESKTPLYLRKICGLLVFLAGGYMLYDGLAKINF